jgi:hypothetical protein
LICVKVWLLRASDRGRELRPTEKLWLRFGGFSALLWNPATNSESLILVMQEGWKQNCRIRWTTRLANNGLPSIAVSKRLSEIQARSGKSKLGSGMQANRREVSLSVERSITWAQIEKA